MNRNKQIDIKRALALAGTFRFLCSCADACLLPFLTLYFRQLGLTPAMTGIVMGARHFIALLWSPAAGLLAKVYNKRRAVIYGSVLFSVAAALLLLLVPPVKDLRTNICNTSEPSVGSTQGLPASSTAPQTSSVWTRAKEAPATSLPVTAVTTSSVSPEENTSVMDTNLATFQPSSSLVRKKRSEMKSEQPHEKVEKEMEVKEEESGLDFLGSLKTMDIQHQLFFLILIIMSLWEFVSAPLEWTVDDGLYEYLDFADASDRYSGSEVWGLLGAACGVGGTGLLVSQLSCFIAAETPRSAVHFYSYAGLAALTLPMASSLPLYLNKKRGRTSGLLKAVQLVQASPRALLCAITTSLVGVAVSSVDNFLLWQMQDHGSTELHMGLSLAVARLSQAAFPLLDTFVFKLLSPGRVLAVSAACLSLQSFYYSFLWGAWAALPAQLLSCFSSGALWWAVKVQCEDVATPGVERNVRRVYTSLSLQLGSGLGSLAGGFVVQRFGLAWLFRGAAAVLLVWCLCLQLLQWKAPRQRRINYSRLLAADMSEASDSESERDWLDKAMEDDRSNNNNYTQRTNH
ncbi:major facilitator superfamily domain-containing protein 6-like isoform X2 [Parambassis ranga]|nr:major facilitator superfamily domain-containing protein 6-like isoform X2 [Parambassis ranga]